jgi:2,5-diamino-6-(ribosylamino)-4(3H)-pyrimidinone 5'-phosphate reductase
MVNNMIPKIIIHNSVSLDGSLTNFEVNMPLHYQLAGRFKADMHLVGSNTAKTGVTMFLQNVPKEKKEDLKKPKDKQGIPWAIPDSKAALKGLLHVMRQSEYCKDVVIFVSENTPKDYVDYLKEREYDYFVCGKKECDLRRVLELLSKEYVAKTILTDTGSILSNLLIEQGLASQISMLVHPVIVGKKSYNMFANIDSNIKLKLVKKEFFENRYLWLVYEVAK